VDGRHGACLDRREIIGTAMGIWTGWSLRLLGVPLLPALCLVHGAVVVWLYEAMSDGSILLVLLALVVFLLLAMAALMVGLAALGLWVWDADDGDSAGGILVAAMLLALGGLAAGYLGTLIAADSWALRWRGAETTCTVRHLLTIGGATPDGSAPVTYFYDLDCAAPDAPDEMRTGSYVEPGEGVPVVYDPHGDAGAESKSEVDGGSAWAWGTGIALATWTVLTLAKVGLEPLRQREASPP
jgi:hypothetical protein